MKIAFFGTPEFAGNILSGILEYPEVEVALIVSQPDKAIGRKKELKATAVKQIALDAGIEIMQAEKIKKNTEFHEYLKSLELDFIVVVAYGKIIPQAILDIPKYGCINIHGSILPKHRGASPVQAAIKDGEIETGLTIMFMSKGMDEGDMLAVGKVKVDNVDTSVDIFEKFVKIGPELLVSTLKGVVSGAIVGVSQDDTKATYCSKISREDGQVFFQKQTAQEIYNTFRAYTPWPGIFTFYEGKRLVLEETQLLHNTSLNSLLPGEKGLQNNVAGQFIKLSKNRYGIICADKKILELKQVKLEGKKSMDILSFLNGNREVLGYIFY